MRHILRVCKVCCEFDITVCFWILESQICVQCGFALRFLVTGRLVAQLPVETHQKCANDFIETKIWQTPSRHYSPINIYVHQ